MTDEEFRTRLWAEAEKAIEQIMAKRAREQALNLREIEALAVQVGEAVSAGVQTVLSEEASQQQRSQGQFCPKCGKRMRSRGEHTRHITTEAGTSPLTRTYYECAECGHHFFPSGRSVGVG